VLRVFLRGAWRAIRQRLAHRLDVPEVSIAVLVELNLLDLSRDVPLMPDVTSWLRERNLVPFDICGLTRRPLDGALWQADLMFVSVDSVLRSDKRWSSV